MEWFMFSLGVLTAGTLMYYIQPWVKTTVARAFLGAPAVLAQAEVLKARADALIALARSKAA